ncbi:hypothetical protein INT45_001682 [Circinella minor]|uniref:Uncharacterized protein n=1 Tax=Circinella minor TaxID=1195481 RepID=A0A8H7S6D0_9FUNG|nr:hypothetical protein INT45_001682 [Circinella minor]
MTFDMTMDQNPTWVLRRVKRVIPPGKDLYPVVKKVFDTYGYLRCAKTGRPLFDDEAWRQSENVLNTIQLGHVSDPPGISFYFEIGKDKNNLPLYRCSRGTNSLEGGLHQNIICKFMSFGASPELADGVMADYRLRHNIDVGSFNRYGRVHKGHYELWLTQHILDLRGSFGMEQSYDSPGVHENAIFFEPSKEVFGISPLQENLAKELGIEVVSSDENIQANNVDFSMIINSILETSALLTFAGSTLATKGARYRFIAQKQWTKFAILPVHTKRENDLFDEKMKTTYKNCTIDWMKFAKNWSTYVNGEDIFYKTLEHLRSYNGKYEQLRTALLSMTMNSESRKEVHDIVSSEDRKRKAPSANKPSTNKVPRYENMTAQASPSLYIASQPTLTNTSDSNRLSSSSNLQMSAIQPLTSYPLQLDPTTQHGSFLTNSNISLSSSLSSSIIRQSITRPLVSWSTNHATSLPDTTHWIYYPSTTQSTITATGSLPYAQDNITNIQTSNQVASPQPTSSRGIQPSSPSSDGPLFIVSNVHLPKYRGRKN